MADSETSVVQKRWTEPNAKFLVPLALAMFCVNGTWMSSSILTLSLKANQISEQGATTILSVAVGVGALFAVIGYPLLGRLSDLTHTKFGRRRPYVLLGAILIAAGAFLQIIATSTLLLSISYSVLVIGCTSVLVAASAMIPDQIEPHKRGMASTIAGLSTAIGTLLGLFLSQLVQDLTLMIVLPAAAAVLGSLLLAFAVPDPNIIQQTEKKFHFRDLLGAFVFNPRKAPAFALVWVNRFMVFIGVAAINAYQTFFLLRSLHVSPAEIGQKIFLATLVLTAASVLVAPLLAKRAEKTDSKKKYLLLSEIVFALGLIMVIFSHSYEVFLASSVVMGLGQGVFFAIDFGLAADVLPDPQNAAKDLGILNLANTLPQPLVSVVAPLLLAVGATQNSQNFVALFIFGAACVGVGVVCLLPLKERRTV